MHKDPEVTVAMRYEHMYCTSSHLRVALVLERVSDFGDTPGEFEGPARPRKGLLKYNCI